MQAADSAEWPAVSVQQVFVNMLRDEARADLLLEHIRYRTGLLLERRPGVFAFAHLTFQEYLAALAVHEGNLLEITAEQLVHEHDDGRWNEVIALYSGLTTATAATAVIELLIAQPDTMSLGNVLGEAYLAAGVRTSGETELRKKVIERIALTSTPNRGGGTILSRFPAEEVAPFANVSLEKVTHKIGSPNSFLWLENNPEYIFQDYLIDRLSNWHLYNPISLAHIIVVIFQYGSDETIDKIMHHNELYQSIGPDFPDYEYNNQNELVLFGLISRLRAGFSSAQVRAFSNSVDLLLKSTAVHCIIIELLREFNPPMNIDTAPQLAELLRKIAVYLTTAQITHQVKMIAPLKSVVDNLNKQAARLEGKVTEPAAPLLHDTHF